jgi:putative isomerase
MLRLKIYLFVYTFLTSAYVLAQNNAATPNVSLQDSGGDVKKYIKICRQFIHKELKGMYRKEGGAFKYPFLAPGSSQYQDQLWDWDSWLSNIALRQNLLESGSEKDKEEAIKYEQGSVLNFLNYGGFDGWIPIMINRGFKPRSEQMPKNSFGDNMHKPVLAQHAAFLTKLNNGDASWIGEKFYEMQTFVNNYLNHHRHKETGLVYWQTDHGIGVDNDPSTYFRPPASSGSIYLNCLMYKELLAMSYLAQRLNLGEISILYKRDAEVLKEKIREHCWDEKDGFYYSVDLNLLHSGGPRSYDCLIQRIGVWSGFMAMWADVATPEHAKRIVEENLRNEKTFNAPAGIRTLSKLEKMYNVKASGNPSSWLGPVWGVSNYMVWKGLVKYGFVDDAKKLAEKSIILFGKDFERSGALHEYYLPENGAPVLNKGFQNWNFLVLNMAAWLEGKPFVEEF